MGPRLPEIDIIVIVERILYENRQGFAVFTGLMEPHYRKTRVRGYFPEIREGQRLKLSGKWVDDSRHGRQFKTAEWEELQPEGRRGLVKFLAGHIAGVGSKLAQTLVNHLGDRVLDVIENRPDELKKIPGIGNRKLKSILSSWEEYRNTARTHVFLKSLDLGPATASKLFRMYGVQAETLIRGNPYRMAREIKGIGFKSADRIAMGLNIPPDSPCRIEAGILFELMEMEDEGHCCLPETDLVDRVSGRLGLAEPSVKMSLQALIEAGEVVLRSGRNREPVVFPRRLDRLESELAGHLVRLAAGGGIQFSEDGETEYRRFLAESGLISDPDQQRAVKALSESSLLVLTGGPGTGKTTLVRVMLRVMRNLKIAMAAPTGRAAQRLQETTGHPASTLHRLLEYHPDTGFFGYHSGNRLPSDAVIVDECSMLDVPLATALVRALKDRCLLILVGDADQLPSVGPGSVFQDLIDSGLAEVVRLNRIFRQSEGSRIVLNAHRIIHGRMPDPGRKNDGGDFFFMEKSEPEAILGLIGRLVQRIADTLEVDPVEGVQVLCPMYRGELGVDRLNEVLRETLNPRGRRIFLDGRPFRIGDKIMQIRNNYDLEVFNGDMGRIVGFNPQTSGFRIRYGPREIEYPPDLSEQIVPAYACSVHKSQGSEYPGAIILLHTQHYMMLRRSVLYTAVTRGRRMVVIVGSKRALAITVRNIHTEYRNTLLVQRIQNFVRKANT